MLPATPFADLDDMLTATTLGMLADVIVIPEGGGAPFAAMLEHGALDRFDGTRVSDWVIRYAAPNVLAKSAYLSVQGSQRLAADTRLQVVADPEPQHGGREFLAYLTVRRPSHVD